MENEYNPLTKEILTEWINNVLKDVNITDFKPFTSDSLIKEDVEEFILPADFFDIGTCSTCNRKFAPRAINGIDRFHLGCDDPNVCKYNKPQESFEDYQHRTADQYSFDYLAELAKKPFDNLSEGEQRSLKYKAGLRAQFINNELSHHINSARKLVKTTITESVDVEILVPKDMMIIINYAIELEKEYLMNETLSRSITLNSIEDVNDKSEYYVIHMHCYLWEHDYDKVNMEGKLRNNIAGNPKGTTKDITFNIGVKIIKLI